MKYFIICALVFALSAPAAAQQKQQYSRVIKSVPVMEGMCEQDPVVDDSTGLPANPNQTSFTFNGKDRQVKTYYSQQFREEGYSNPDPMKPDYYVNKNGDEVTVNTSYVNGQTVVTITKKPHDEQPPQEAAPAEQPQDYYQQPQQPPQETYEFDPSQDQ